MAETIIDIDPYDHQMILFYGSTVKEIKTFLKSMEGIKNKDIRKFTKGIDSVKGRACEFGDGGTFVYIQEGLDNVELINTLTHECFHIVTFVLDRVGIPFSFKTDEVYAYLLSNLVTKCITAVFKTE